MVTVILYVILSLSAPPLHDIHVSVTEIIPTDNHLNVTVKIFFDDLQIALGLEPGAELPAHYSSSDEMIASYLSEHLHLTINGKSSNLIYISSDAGPQAVWCQLSCENVDINNINSVSLFNNIFTEIYDDQDNIVKWVSMGNNKQMLLDEKKTEALFKF